MAKIKQVAKYDGSSWGIPYNLGADAVNIDVVTGENTTDNLQNLMDNIQEDISDIQTDLENKVGTEDLSGFDFTKTYLETTGNSANTVVNGITNSSDTSADISSGMQGNNGESTVSLWNKYNKFVKRVGNKFANYLSTSNFNTWANNVIGYNLTSTAPSSTLQAQIISVNNNKVAKTGDTMTGQLSFQSSNIDTSTTPSSNTYGRGVILQDANSVTIGSVRPFHLTDGSCGLQLAVVRTVGGTDVQNTFRLEVDASGNRVVYVNGGSAWCSGIGAVAQSDYESAVLTSYTDISGYNSSSNLYTIPSDGYIYLSNASGQSAEGVLYGADATSAFMRFGSSQGRWSQFVKKGMKVYLNGTAQTFRYVRL